MKTTQQQAKNRVRIELAALSENESFARAAVAAFAAQLNPTIAELDDLKTAVSEAVTNCVVHAYSSPPATAGKKNQIVIECKLYNREIIITVTDFGIGIENIEKAMEPFYTTKPDDERSGMGFTVMQTFMDDLAVKSGKSGTKVTMRKKFSPPRKTATIRGKIFNVITKDKENKACGG